MATFKTNVTTTNIPDEFLSYIRTKLHGLTHGDVVIKVHDGIVKFVDRNEKDKIECRRTLSICHTVITEQAGEHGD